VKALLLAEGESKEQLAKALDQVEE